MMFWWVLVVCSISVDLLLSGCMIMLWVNMILVCGCENCVNISFVVMVMFDMLMKIFSVVMMWV